MRPSSWSKQRSISCTEEREGEGSIRLQKKILMLLFFTDITTA